VSQATLVARASGRTGFSSWLAGVLAAFLVFGFRLLVSGFRVSRSMTETTLRSCGVVSVLDCPGIVSFRLPGRPGPSRSPVLPTPAKRLSLYRRGRMG